MTKIDPHDVDLLCYDTHADMETAKDALVKADNNFDLALANILESRHQSSSLEPAPTYDKHTDPHDVDLLCYEAQTDRETAKNALIRTGNDYNLALTDIVEKRSGYKPPRTKPRYTYDEPIGFKGRYRKRNADDE